MSTNTFVYPHPINAYVIGQLGVPVEQFCELHDFAQSTVASWITRERAVATLPVSFIHALALASSKSMDYVYSELLDAEEQYMAYKKKYKRKKKNILED